MKNPDTSIHLGRSIACMRMIKGMKQSALASLPGISQQAVSNMEKRKDISYSRLLHVANVLGVSAEALQAFKEAGVMSGTAFSGLGRTHITGE